MHATKNSDGVSATGRIFSNSSYVDIATNFAYFDSIDLSSDLKDFLDRDFRVKHLLTLVHETTHHWCLTTEVGTALAAHACRAYHDAGYAWSRIKNDLDMDAMQRRLPSSIITSRMFTTFFVPLLEGLALYAEWRAVPRKGVIYSRPFDIFRLFSGRTNQTEQGRRIFERFVQHTTNMSPDEFDAYAREFTNTPEGERIANEENFHTTAQLGVIRLDPDERSRLETIFSSSIDPRHGSYQLGYLFVCGLERICEGHRNTDMFLAFLRTYFFNDLELATVLLNDDKQPEEMYLQIYHGLHTKVSRLVSNGKQIFDHWGEEVPFAPILKRNERDFFGIADTAMSPKEAENRQRFRSALSLFVNPISMPLIPGRDLYNFLGRARALMRLGAKEFNVTAKRKGRIVLRSVDGQEIEIKRSELQTVPRLGDPVEVSLLVNVASPGLAISLRWKTGFSALALESSPISNRLINEFYSQADLIASILNTGQQLIDKLGVVTNGKLHRLDADASNLEGSDKMAQHILQIYGLPIALAFSQEEPPQMIDAAWVRTKLSIWQPEGIRSLLGSQELLEALLRVVGALHFTINPNQVHSGAKPELQETCDRIFEIFNKVNRVEYEKIVKVIGERLSHQGIELFGETLDHRFVSLV